MFDSHLILSGNRRALARLLTHIENATPEAATALAALFPHTGRAHRVGVTGSPGTGKSSLVNELAKALRRQGRTVAIVAVDPSSPFTGGAILGDRIRMRDLSGDPGVFIRSMASRGSLGGLARATSDVVQALDAAGFEMILIETVGAGQTEVEIARAAHTTIVVEAPGLGDDVQAIKAGLLEVADIFALNKADQPGVENALRALRVSLDLAHPGAHHWQTDSLLAHHADPAPALAATNGALWVPPIVQTVAVQGQGIDELVQEIDRHRAQLNTSGELARRERDQLTHELETHLRDLLLTGLLMRLGEHALRATLEKVWARALDPATAAQQLIDEQVTVTP